MENTLSLYENDIEIAMLVGAKISAKNHIVNRTKMGNIVNTIATITCDNISYDLTEKLEERVLKFKFCSSGGYIVRGRGSISINGNSLTLISEPLTNEKQE